MLEEVFSRGWDNFIARTSGPMSFRFIIQPTLAAFLGIRAGLRDARADRPAFFWSLLTKREKRQRLFQDGLKDTSKVLLVAALLDAIYQLSVQNGVYLVELMFTVGILALGPYILIRDSVNRVATWLRKGENERLLRPDRHRRRPGRG